MVHRQARIVLIAVSLCTLLLSGCPSSSLEQTKTSTASLSVGPEPDFVDPSAVPFISQWERREECRKRCTGWNNCGPASLAMATEYYGKRPSETSDAEFVAWIRQKMTGLADSCSNSFTDMNDVVSACQDSEVDLLSERLETVEDITEALANGKLVICAVNAQKLAPSQYYAPSVVAGNKRHHIILVTGLGSVKNHKVVYVNDPLSNLSGTCPSDGRFETAGPSYYTFDSWKEAVEDESLPNGDLQAVSVTASSQDSFSVQSPGDLSATPSGSMEFGVVTATVASAAQAEKEADEQSMAPGLDSTEPSLAGEEAFGSLLPRQNSKILFTDEGGVWQTDITGLRRDYVIGNGWFPTWDPKGERIAVSYKSDLDEPLEVLIYDTVGGTEESVASFSSDISVTDLQWRDLRSLLVILRSGRILSIDPTTKEVDEIFDADPAGTPIANPHLSPSGESVAYYTSTPGSRYANAVAVADRDLRSEDIIFEAGPTLGMADIAWSPNGASIAFLANIGHTREEPSGDDGSSSVTISDLSLVVCGLLSGKCEVVAHGGMEGLGSITWLDEGSYLAFAATEGIEVLAADESYRRFLCPGREPEAFPLSDSRLSSRLEAREELLSALETQNVDVLDALDVSWEPSTVAIQGGHAYIGSQARIAIVDISNPRDIRFERTTEFLDWGIRDIAVREQFVYATDGDSMDIVDMGSQNTSVMLGSVDEIDPSGLEIRQDHAYLADRRLGLRVIDVSNPDDPIEVAQHNLSEYGNACDICISGDMAILSVAGDDVRGPGGVFLLDIADPNHPWLVSSCTRDMGITHEVEVFDNHVYVADSGGLKAIDISNPQKPHLVGGYDLDLGYSWYDTRNLSVYAGKASFFTGLGFCILDVSKPSSISLEREITIDKFASDLNLSFSDNIGYLASQYGIISFSIE